MAIPFREAQFNANLPLPSLGRGRHKVQVTASRQRHSGVFSCLGCHIGNAPPTTSDGSTTGSNDPVRHTESRSHPPRKNSYHLPPDTADAIAAGDREFKHSIHGFSVGWNWTGTPQQIPAVFTEAKVYASRTNVSAIPHLEAFADGEDFADGSLGMDGNNDGGIDDMSGKPAWSQPAYDGDDNGDDQPSAVSSLANPHVSGNGNTSSPPCSNAARRRMMQRRAMIRVKRKPGTPICPQRGSRSRAALPRFPQTIKDICNLAFNHLKIELTHHIPFPVVVGHGPTGRSQTDEFSELILKAFTNTAFNLGLEHVKPNPEDIKLFRSGVKVIASLLVPAAFNLVDIKTLPNPMPACINAQLEKNRAGDPDNISPETIYWFGSVDNDRAFYFEEKPQVELVTLALIIVTLNWSSQVLCAIEEWSTGCWENKEFTHKAYFKAYKNTLSGLKRWMAHSEKQVKENTPCNTTIKVQEQMLRVARAASYKPEEDPEQEDDRDMFSLEEMFNLASGGNVGTA
ncbi:hypothetical protein B0H10DRAFT_1944946 [Mycena sp. CBHHK59/15]|nr:hypothetical protein B0H10DRAFT_1944946 [Mycena sp. CBHHK59/15]